MNKYLYYIKTEKEFKEEFGWNWREIGSLFIGDMDYLLGTEFDILKFPQYIQNGRFILNGTRIELDGFYLSNEMIKEVKIINYNEKRKLVYE